MTITVRELKAVTARRRANKRIRFVRRHGSFGPDIDNGEGAGINTRLPFHRMQQLVRRGVAEWALDTEAKGKKRASPKRKKSASDATADSGKNVDHSAPIDSGSDSTT